MKRALLLLLLASGARAEERVLLETDAPATCFVHEPVRVVLRIAYDRAFFAEHAVQMFQRGFDLPVQVRAPWLDTVAGAALRVGESPADGVSLVLNGEAGVAAPAGERAVGGRRFAVVEIARTLLPERPGELVLAAPELRYVHATRFREDFFEGRVPVDRHDASARGSSATVTVNALPEAGRPAAFTGAVGRFAVAADAMPRALDAGDVLKLTLRVRGEGNLARFATPRLDDLPGFHVYGMLDDRATPRRTIVYDLAPLDAGVTEVPPIALAYFDPEAGEYRTARTAPIPLTVRGAAPAEPPPAADAGGWPPWAWVLPLLALAALWVLLRRPAPPPADARARFEQRADTDLADAFIEYLAARLGCPPAAVIAPDLEQRLVRAGVAREAAARASALVERLVGARYGGRADADAAAETRALVAAIERQG